ncbi:hypothetical protein SPI_01483 [Niveomyces insectorum RCEF 264]|uniref:DUF2828 domain containing protein n=1 Tax=Niveomyces insectorum RCEF 264 TaxID=1081102 RepID=A0A167Z027_9HYPO|nr:hypothetical protein SPI_01483 [Niveomyces insectorum RCEF 264]
MATQENAQQADLWFLRSKFPVLYPSSPLLSQPNEQFEAAIRADIVSQQAAGAVTDDAATVVDTGTSSVTTAQSLPERNAKPTPVTTGPAKPTGNPFVDGLLVAGRKITDRIRRSEANAVADMPNRMLTENGGIALRSTTDPVVDLFYELEEVVPGPRVRQLLDAAWAYDPLATLKIIVNARSIHLGKGARPVFYRCTGWLLQHHPLTLLSSLPWLVRPVIEKKVEKKGGKDEKDDVGVVMIEAKDVDENDSAHFNVRNGVSHGYWKDLLNILALASRDMLDPLEDPRKVLNPSSKRATPDEDKDKDKDKDKDMDEGQSPGLSGKAARHHILQRQHARVVQRFESDATFRALYVTVARLFADQLAIDLAALHGTDGDTKRHISLCAKWAPSMDRFHDRQTFVVSAIAERLHPASSFSTTSFPDRETYLRHARDAYRRDVSALRQHLAVVERDLSASTLDRIAYDRVPSVAMHNYRELFAIKDKARFVAYLTRVEAGEATISGATLLPSKMVQEARRIASDRRAPKDRLGPTAKRLKKKKAKQKKRAKTTDGAAETTDTTEAMEKTKETKEAKETKETKETEETDAMTTVAAIQTRQMNAQWNTLVQRIKDSGSLDNCMAICDVSGSMNSPTFADGTCPMDSAIGLSLLLAEVCRPPFQGVFVTFSAWPAVERIDLTQGFVERVRAMESADWGNNTNLAAVFKDLILPMAVKHQVQPKDMVKRLFVFSDMQFDAAKDSRSSAWNTAYEDVQKQYKRAGYEVPELVFWNLAGGRAGYRGGTGGDPTAPKPVASDTPGTALVSGYSQAMLKVFLESSSFVEPDAAEDEVVAVDMKEDDAEDIVDVTKTTDKNNPLSVVKKVISHKAYAMLKVVD